MRCQEIEVYLSGYLDKELPQQQRQRVQSHLEDCEHCRQVLERLRQAQNSTRELHIEMPSGEEWADLRNFILGRISRRLGWLVLLVWLLMVSLYSLYWYATEPNGSMIEKIIVFGAITGLGLLFLSVLSERIRDLRSDRYRGVHR